MKAARKLAVLGGVTAVVATTLAPGGTSYAFVLEQCQMLLPQATYELSSSVSSSTTLTNATNEAAGAWTATPTRITVVSGGGASHFVVDAHNYGNSGFAGLFTTGGTNYADDCTYYQTGGYFVWYQPVTHFNTYETDQSLYSYEDKVMIIAHEMGHMLGLDHSGSAPCSATLALMDGSASGYACDTDYPEGDDINGVNVVWPHTPVGAFQQRFLSGYCLDVQGGSAVNGTPIQIYTCNGTAAQSWTVGTDGTVRALGKCLDVSGSGTTNGTKIQLYTCNGTAAQQWRLWVHGNVTSRRYSLANTHSGKCVDDPGQSTVAGTNVQLYTCNDTAAQIWYEPF